MDILSPHQCGNIHRKPNSVPQEPLGVAGELNHQGQTGDQRGELITVTGTQILAISLNSGWQGDTLKRQTSTIALQGSQFTRGPKSLARVSIKVLIQSLSLIWKQLKGQLSSGACLSPSKTRKQWQGSNMVLGQHLPSDAHCKSSLDQETKERQPVSSNVVFSSGAHCKFSPEWEESPGHHLCSDANQ